MIWSCMLCWPRRSLQSYSPSARIGGRGRETGGAIGAPSVSCGGAEDGVVEMASTYRESLPRFAGARSEYLAAAKYSPAKSCTDHRVPRVAGSTFRWGRDMPIR
jgi:hypothetical protein